MKVVILCGGQGTRIRAASEELPKPMLLIGGRPILWHIMKSYASFGHEDFVLCIGHKGWLIKEYFLNYRAMSSDITIDLGRTDAVEVHGRPGSRSDEAWRVTLADTGEHTMTGGRVAAIRRYVEDEDLFCLTYGDGVADIDLGALLEFHRSSGRIATVTAVRPPGRFGEMEVEGSQVLEFDEKPQTTRGKINGGFFVFDAKRIWPYLEGSSGLILEQEPLRRLTADGELSAFPHEGFWLPMDTYREYKHLNDLWEAGTAPWKSWE
ncbi:MAG: glucose-1-phosphate cytidylyltransferase [Planctomycetota bacterium]